MTPFMNGGADSPLSTFVMVVIVIAIAGYVTLRVGIAFVLRYYWAALHPQFRQPSQILIWLNIIPVFAAVLNFFIFPALARSYREALESEKLGELDELRYLDHLAWGYAILYVFPLTLYIVPDALANAVINLPYAIEVLLYADLVVLALFFVRLHPLKQNLDVASKRPNAA